MSTVPETFGSYIRRVREEHRLPLRKVADYLGIDISTLSKVERGERSLSIELLEPLSIILLSDLKEIQINYIAETINNDLGELKFLPEGLKYTSKLILKQTKV